LLLGFSDFSPIFFHAYHSVPGNPVDTSSLRVKIGTDLVIEPPSPIDTDVADNHEAPPSPNSRFSQFLFPKRSAGGSNTSISAGGRESRLNFGISPAGFGKTCFLLSLFFCLLSVDF
jgi:hypothetical protein